LLPVGISFYTFQALSYLMDVYRGEIRPEKNLLRYALFVSFFPQLVAGPIERSGRLLPQIAGLAGRKRSELWNSRRIMEGLLLMLWGLFMKLTIADRVSPFVQKIYEEYREMGAVEIAVAAVLFSLQIYCDFGGYTCIARGAARVLGIELMQNFRQPYFATGIRDFWRRWHISLTSWFTDYLYIPLGGNRKGTARRYLNILIVFGLSGLWHGASWNYVIWGLLHAFFQITEDVFRRRAGRSFRIPGILRIAGTFFIVTVAWIFFAADSCSQAVGILGQCFRAFHLRPILSLGLDVPSWMALGICIMLLVLVDLAHEKGKSVFAGFRKVALPMQAVVSAVLLWTVILLGAYGGSHDATFIYFRF
ncbi:MAG: MBOAT family protein, partial [Lachnospiraceae bacterium]|nr:MBOAT family protein [Lachnospiraceae bacterium]